MVTTQGTDKFKVGHVAGKKGGNKRGGTEECRSVMGHAKLSLEILDVGF